MFTLHSSLQSAIDAGDGLPGALLFLLARSSGGTIYRTTHSHDISWNSQTWVADGLVVGVSQIPMPGRIIADNWSFTLSAIDPQFLDPFERQQARIYLALLNSNGVVVGDALRLSQGTMNLGALAESRGRAIQVVNVEMSWNRGVQTAAHFRTDDGQQDRFPGDRAFREMPKQRNAFTGGANVNVFR